VKPAPFDYAAPETIEEALELLDEDALVLAGGQSLVPLLNLRLARPARLVDVTRIRELATLRRREGSLWIGATVRQSTLERSPLVARDWPLLAQAVRYAGHAAIRSRGTVGGSVAHADPRAELPVALTALNARFHVRSATGERVIDDCALEPGDLLTAIELPPLPPRARTAFAEYAPTRGSFATAGVAVVRAPGHAAIALLGTGRATAAEDALAAGDVRAAAELAAAEVTHPHGRALVAALAREAIAAAAPRDTPPADAPPPNA
jgi:CO/xanthine dehydrogenase FAD-binding subunit